MKKVMGMEIPNGYLRTLYSWISAKKPSKTASEKQKNSYFFKYIIAYVYFEGIGPMYHKFITRITRYYPFSLLYKGTLLHADAEKAKDLMRGMEAVAERAGIPIYINRGVHERVLSIFHGIFEKKGINKKDTVQKLQDLFEGTYGTVYVQQEKTGFRVLVDSNLL
jgi:hypothetical protein